VLGNVKHEILTCYGILNVKP